MVSLCWLRSDLRILDNTALWHARQKGPTVAVFYATPLQWQRHDMAGCRARFVLQSLSLLRADLSQLGIPLLYRQVPTYADIAADLAGLADYWPDTELFWNREYAVNELVRDRQVLELLQQRGRTANQYDDAYILPPGSVVRDDGGRYQIFTPFSRAWKTVVAARIPSTLPAPAAQQPPASPDSGEIPAALAGFATDVEADIWPAGEQAAERRLRDFIVEPLDCYAKQRDRPAVAGTSGLSPYLALGAISARRCLHAALAANRGEIFSGSEGALRWIGELIWRDFYGHILAANPQLSKHRAFRREYERLAWRQDDAQFQAWCTGRTGIPLVDAGMRQLRSTGWMHNRVRMVTAMFLSKNLLLDWRLGERHFMRHLIDGDLAQNNGGWQWSASTGTDAVPYFRIFNPFTQAQRFDPDGAYICTWVPELADLPPDVLHHPARLAARKPATYPDPIVDIALSRRRAMAAFKQVSG